MITITKITTTAITTTAITTTAITTTAITTTAITTTAITTTIMIMIIMIMTGIKEIKTEYGLAMVHHLLNSDRKMICILIMLVPIIQFMKKHPRPLGQLKVITSEVPVLDPQVQQVHKVTLVQSAQ